MLNRPWPLLSSMVITTITYRTCKCRCLSPCHKVICNPGRLTGLSLSPLIWHIKEQHPCQASNKTKNDRGFKNPNCIYSVYPTLSVFNPPPHTQTHTQIQKCEYNHLCGITLHQWKPADTQAKKKKKMSRWSQIEGTTLMNLILTILLDDT